MKSHPRAPEERHQRTLWWQSPMDGRTAADFVVRAPAFVTLSTPRKEAERIASDLGTHFLAVVTDSDEAVGVACLCDLWRARPDAEVSSCMSSPAEVVEVGTSIEDVVEVMRETHFGCLPVMEEGRVVGVLTRGDLHRAGVISGSEAPKCAICQSYHHVRIDAGTGSKLCLSCLGAVHPWNLDDRDEEFPGGD